MSTRRGFLKLLGIGATSVVVAPMAAKAASVPMVVDPAPVEALPAVRVLEGELLGPVQPFNGNPHLVTKEQVGLGRIATFEEMHRGTSFAGKVV